MEWIQDNIFKLLGFTAFSAFAVITFILLLVVYLYPKTRILIADILKFFGWACKWIRRRSVEYELDGTINSCCQKINSELSGVKLPQCKVNFVTSKNKGSYLNEGVAIVRVSFSRNHDLNFYNAASSYIKTGLLTKTKPFLKEATSKAIDLLMTHILLSEGHRTALQIFNSKFKAESEDCRETYFKLDEILSNGVFTRILIPEYYNFGELVYTRTPDEELLIESERFFDWLNKISIREKGELSALVFKGNFIKVGVILVAEESIYLKWGIDPYLRRANYYATNDFNSVYLLSRGKKGHITKNIAKDLSKDRSFVILNHYCPNAF